MPSSPAFLAIFSFTTSPTPCCPFLLLTPLQPPLKNTWYPDANISEVPYLFVPCSSMTSRPYAAQSLSRVSMCPIPLTPFTPAAVRTLNVPNASSSSRDLALAALSFLRVDLLSARFPRRLFRANALHLSFSSRCFVPRSLPLVFRRSPSSTLLLTRVCPPSILPLLASSPTFSATAVFQLCYRRHGYRRNRFLFAGVHHRQSMMLAGLHLMLCLCFFISFIADAPPHRSHHSSMQVQHSYNSSTIGWF